MALIAKARYDARPIKPRAAIVATVGVRQIELRIDGAVGNPGFRRVGRSYQKRHDEEEEGYSHSITLSQMR